MRLFVSVAVLSLALATSVSAGQPPANPRLSRRPTKRRRRPRPTARRRKDGVVCRKEMPTGSHFPVKVCTTAEEPQGAAERDPSTPIEIHAAFGEVVPRLDGAHRSHASVLTLKFKTGTEDNA
jgi:hypothetical protein